MHSVPTDPLIGHTLDQRYVVRSRIARGGMAVVYLGNDLRLERRVAIKIMHAHLAEDESFTKRFEQEARSAAGLGHPNVVSVYDQGVDRGVPYLVMEYLPGITLRELLKQQRRLTTEQSLEIGEAVLAGLAAAHTAGIVHRDLKPENVLLADDGRIKIGDFGLARAVSANTTTGQALLGTIAYLSPELVTRGVADARSDLYAFGIMLFEMLTGQQPFQGEQPMQIAYQHAHSDIPAPSSLVPGVDPEIDELVRWCAQRDPDARPDDANRALEALRRIRGGGTATRVIPAGGLAVDPLTPSTTVLSDLQQHELAASTGAPRALPEPRPAADALTRARSASAQRTRRGRWITLAVLAILLLAGGAGWWWGQGPGSQVTVPAVSGLEVAVAQESLEALSLVVAVSQCSSLEVAAGLAAATEPAAGTRVDRGSEVQLCVSTGPELLPVPTLVGLDADAAISAIEAAGFSFGEVLERRFDANTPNTVIAALGEDGAGLGETYPERGRVDLIVSAGAIPDVTDMTVDAASAALQAVGLAVDPALNTEAHDEDIPAGQAIGVVTATDPVRAGDAVGLALSLGPQLYPVPDVAGMNVNDAAAALRAAGFAVSTGLVPEGPAGALFEVKSTSPAAGEMRRAGTEIALRYI